MKSSVQVACIVMALVQPASAQTGESHFALSAAQVALALSAAGMPSNPAQVSLPANVVATEPNPALDILSVDRFNDEPSSEPRSRVKLACRLPGACLPFYAIVRKLQGSPSTEVGSRPRPEVTMRAGTHATLILDDHRARIQLAVISLENGAAGKWIRVASPDHKQIYRGEVVTSNLLRGTF